ncbi:TPA: XRE family transcriptional regulator [Candidatus Bipolaricaulota bacterium]|nr:XRE family transcriptional regulator [Candidatus Bipolaricaulota bacterium]
MAKRTWVERIKDRMAEIGWTQTRLAKESGVSRRDIHRILSGKTRNPRYTTRSKILNALGLTELSLEDARALMDDPAFATLWMVVLQDPQRTGVKLHQVMVEQEETPLSLSRKSGVSTDRIMGAIGGGGLRLDDLVRLASALRKPAAALVHLAEGIQFRDRAADAKEILAILRKNDSESEEFVRRVIDLWRWLGLG